MVITVTCPSCSSAFPVDPAKIPEGGVNARCSSCGDIFRVEKPPEAPAPPTLEALEPVAEAPAPPEPEPTPVPEVVEPVAQPPVEETPSAPAMMDYAEPAPPEDPVSYEAPVAEPFAEVPPPLPEVEAAPPEPEPEVELPPLPEFTPAEAAADPFAEAAPFEEPAVVEPETAPAVQGFTFGKRDPTDKAKRLARVLVSDMVMYNAERHQSALATGTLVQDFEEEIDKSWKEFVDQVGEELANGAGRGFWTEALNDILAKGEQVF